MGAVTSIWRSSLPNFDGTIMLAEEQKAQVYGVPVYCTLHHPTGCLHYYDEAFFCGPGRYPIKHFAAVLARVKKYNLKDSRLMEQGIRQSFKHLKEKPVEQYEALVPLDFERHLYGGSKLYDTETSQYRTLSAVTKTSRKSGFTTTLLFVGGFKHTLNDTEGLMNVTKRYRWVTLRNVPQPPKTLQHFTPQWGMSEDTGITEAGKRMVEDLFDKKIFEHFERVATMKRDMNAPKKKKRWFR